MRKRRRKKRQRRDGARRGGKRWEGLRERRGGEVNRKGRRGREGGWTDMEVGSRCAKG